MDVWKLITSPALCFIEQDESAVNLDSLARQVAKCIKSRGYLEKRPNVQEDNGLIGLLNLFTVVIKHKPPFHSSVEGQVYMSMTFLVTLNEWVWL